MEYPLTLPLEEQKERYEFAGFINRTFDFARESSTQFEGSLTAEVLLSIYKAYKPGTQLTIDMIAHTIMFGGYMNERGLVYFKIKPEVFKLLNVGAQEKILSYCNYARSLSLRQIMLGNAPEAVDRDVALDESFRHFTQTQVFGKKLKYWAAVPKGQRNTGTSDLYDYYQSWCLKKHYMPRDKKSLLKVMQNLGYKVKRGYYKGISGTMIVEACVIPQTEEERQLTFDKYGGIGVIKLQDRLIFNDGSIADDFSHDGLKAYIESRRCVSSAESRAEKKRQEEKEQEQAIKSEDTDRIGDEISSNSLCQGTQTLSQGEERRINYSNNAESNQITQIHKNTEDRNTTNRFTKNTQTKLQYVEKPSLSGTIARPLTGQNLSTAIKHRGNTKSNERIESIPSRSNQKDPKPVIKTEQVALPIDGAIKKALYTGLRVTYRLNKELFNFGFFCEEVSQANIGLLSKEQLKLLYDDFMKTIKK